MKLCIKCKHYQLDRDQEKCHRCKRPIIDMVTGKETPADRSAHNERHAYSLAINAIPDKILCGEDGRYFEEII